MDDEKRLREIIRFEIDPDYFEHEEDEESVFDNPSFSSRYKIAYDDIVAACHNMIDADIDEGVLDDWIYYVSEVLSEYYEWPVRLTDFREALWGATDDNMIELLFHALHEISYSLEYFDSPITVDAIDEILILDEDHQYNKGKKLGEWRIGRLHRNILIGVYTERSDLMSDEQKARYKQLIEEACAEKDLLAMRIKGYACYGGSDLYECDWEASRDIITELFDMTGDPQCANTLGYIYYYGRCNGGVPEYDKAFQYYAVGAAHDLLESMYKQADMFKHGYGCIKSERTSEYIIDKLYADTWPCFCKGDDAKFADIALRRAEANHKRGNLVTALKCYLEADYAIKKRLKESDFFGDVKVQEKITNGLNEVKKEFPEEFFVDEFSIRYPYHLLDFLDRAVKYKVTITPIHDNHYRFRLEAVDNVPESNIFIVIPELESIVLANTFECELVADEIIECSSELNGDFVINDAEMVGPHDMILKCDGDVVLEIDGLTFILRRIDF